MNVLINIFHVLVNNMDVRICPKLFKNNVTKHHYINFANWKQLWQKITKQIHHEPFSREKILGKIIFS